MGRSRGASRVPSRALALFQVPQGRTVPEAQRAFHAPKGLVQETIICIKMVNLLR